MLAFILLFIITLIVAYILGLTLVNVVDKRLSNISINIPKQNVTVNMENFTNQSDQSNQSNQSNKQNKELPQSVDEPHNFADMQQTVENMRTPEIGGADKYRDFKLRPDLFNQDSTPENVCLLNHTHGNCTYGPTNYPDPQDMSTLERRAFANNYPANLTLQDYANWLYTNKHNRANLSKEHNANLNKIENKIPLRYEAGVTPPPSTITKPENASEHFANLYKDNPQFKYSLTHPLHQSDPNIEAFTASNYEDAETLSDANDLGTPYDTTLPTCNSNRKFNAKTLFDMTTPQIQPERFVHVSPSKPIKVDHHRV